MKIFAFIMAILVLALSVIPCADNDALSSKESVKTEIAKSANQQENPMQDDCSPFCLCNCCAGFSINHTIASLTFIPPPQSNSTGTYLPAELIEVALPIWQPPQLV